VTASLPPPPEGGQPGVRYWLGQLGGLTRKILVFTLIGIGLALLIRFAPRTMVLLVPLAVLLFGTGLYAWLRVRMRRKDRQRK
jgi:hypothetical protein